MARGDEPGPVTVKLAPWGVVTGRIVDDEGRPRANLQVSGIGRQRSEAKRDRGRFPEAAKVLANAHTPDQPDWRILSAQGVVLDQLGRHRVGRLTDRQARPADQPGGASAAPPTAPSARSA